MVGRSVITTVTIDPDLKQWAKENNVAVSTVLNAALMLLKLAGIMPRGKNTATYMEALIEASHRVKQTLYAEALEEARRLGCVEDEPRSIGDLISIFECLGERQDGGEVAPWRSTPSSSPGGWTRQSRG
jgi:hypothetical protein